MPPFRAPRVDATAMRSSRAPPLPAEACADHRRAVPVHAKALDLITVETALATDPSLLCIIYTYGKNHPAAKVATETWLPYCDGALVLSDVNDTDVRAVAVPHEGPEEYQNIWQKTRANWRYVSEYYLDDFDYFVFGGDDMFVLADNLKRYLASPEVDDRNARGDPLFLGRRFKQNNNWDRLFNSGGAGYVLNRPALKLLYDSFDHPDCQPHLKGFWEDVMVAQCLRKRSGGNLLPYDTRDLAGRERFHPFTPGQHLTYRARPDSRDWYVRYSIDLKQGPECCSTQSVAYHYIKPDLMRHMDALLFRCPRASIEKPRRPP
ncbi:hypothetical protein CTAYLR_007429 [Chrysophaeum taylorii]|uniref:N-acetylgalactosaminide beta-1,3-galactosyltransferase n=1 Tax=Chrysophaeum taylorii TaxID=2483200 RepID=A0AAD7U9G3_9STRA|nr:hypothetical protein CTAYLR_007429 [Chrysophaeum taylorii]